MTQMIPVTARSSPPGRASLVRQKSRRVAAQHCVGARRRVCVCVCVCVFARARARSRGYLRRAMTEHRDIDHASRFLCVLCMRACAMVPCEHAYPFLQGTTPPFWMPILPRKYCQKLRETRHMKTARPGQTPPMAARLPATPSSSVRVLVLWWRPPRSSLCTEEKEERISRVLLWIPRPSEIQRQVDAREDAMLDLDETIAHRQPKRSGMQIGPRALFRSSPCITRLACHNRRRHRMCCTHDTKLAVVWCIPG